MGRALGKFLRGASAQGIEVADNEIRKQWQLNKENRLAEIEGMRHKRNRADKLSDYKTGRADKLSDYTHKRKDDVNDRNYKGKGKVEESARLKSLRKQLESIEAYTNKAYSSGVTDGVEELDKRSRAIRHQIFAITDPKGFDEDKAKNRAKSISAIKEKISGMDEPSYKKAIIQMQKTGDYTEGEMAGFQRSFLNPSTDGNVNDITKVPKQDVFSIGASNFEGLLGERAALKQQQADNESKLAIQKEDERKASLSFDRNIRPTYNSTM